MERGERIDVLLDKTEELDYSVSIAMSNQLYYSMYCNFLFISIDCKVASK